MSEELVFQDDCMEAEMETYAEYIRDLEYCKQENIDPKTGYKLS